MLKTYIPVDSIISYSKHSLFKVENILKELNFSVQVFSDFLKTYADIHYFENQSDSFLMKALYEYLLKEISLKIQEQLEEDIFSFDELKVINLFESEIDIKQKNGVVVYHATKETLEEITGFIDLIPEEQRDKSVKWFLHELERCTNTVF